MHGIELLLQKAFQLVGTDLAHGHQAEVVGDERHQVFFFKDERILGKQVALIRLLDVCIQGLEATDLNGFKQFVQDHQQLALKLFAASLE
ncbi:hypothetical protein D3C76_1619270 [compost metagenome]